MDLEAREYGPELTPEERAMLLARVYLHEPGIVVYREIPMPTPTTVDMMLAYMAELGLQSPKFVEVLDLTGVRRPDAEVRAIIRRWMKQLGPRLIVMNIILKANPVMKSVAKFLGYAMGVRVQFFDTEAQALEAARRAWA